MSFAFFAAKKWRDPALQCFPRTGAHGAGHPVVWLCLLADYRDMSYFFSCFVPVESLRKAKQMLDLSFPPAD